MSERTFTCREPGCDAPVTSDRGVACRCPEHRKATAPTRPRPEPARAVGPSFEERAKELLAAGKELDKARERARVALADVNVAKARYEAAARELILDKRGEE